MIDARVFDDISKSLGKLLPSGVADCKARLAIWIWWVAKRSMCRRLCSARRGSNLRCWKHVSVPWSPRHRQVVVLTHRWSQACAEDLGCYVARL